MICESYSVARQEYLILVLLLASCAVLSPVDSENPPDPSSWQPAIISQDIYQLTRRAESGKSRNIVEYMATRMVGVQPIFGDSMIIQSRGSRHVVFEEIPGNKSRLGRRSSPQSRVLPETGRIESQTKRHEAPLNAMGFIAGRDPGYASELIIIATVPEWTPPDSESSIWMPAAFLLEFLRRYPARNTEDTFPRRTILVVMGNGAALQTVFEYPIWVRRKISSVLTIGYPGSGRIVVGNDTIPVFGHPIPEITESGNIQDQTKTSLEDFETKVHQLDQRALEEE